MQRTHTAGQVTGRAEQAAALEEPERSHHGQAEGSGTKGTLSLIEKAQDSIDEERNSFKAVTDRLKFDNDYLRLEIEKMKGRIPAQSEVDSRN